MWRDTIRFPQFFMLDARVLFPLLLAFVHWAKWTLIVALIFVGLAWGLNYLGYTPKVAALRIRGWLVGALRTAGPGVRLMRRRARG